jgi:hypothetical protein
MMAASWQSNGEYSRSAAAPSWLKMPTFARITVGSPLVPGVNALRVASRLRRAHSAALVVASRGDRWMRVTTSLMCSPSEVRSSTCSMVSSVSPSKCGQRRVRPSRSRSGKLRLRYSAA